MADSISKCAAVSVARVGENDSFGNSVLLGTRKQAKRDVGLGLKRHLRGNMRLRAQRLGVGPRVRKIQLHIDGNVRPSRRCGERNDHLTVGNFAQRAAVLTLHSD